MIRNDYRRALIMLRTLLNGYSGHARIEVRTLAGTLSALAGIPQGERSVYAALVGNYKGKYYAAPLGAFRRDMRGQGVMTVTFDPRDIGGRPLEAYSLLTLVEVAGDKRDIAMVGNLNGSVVVDWGKARDAACALYRTQTAPVSELLSEKAPEEEEPEQQENIIWELPAPKAQEEEEEEEGTQEETPEESCPEETQEEAQPEELEELPLVEEEAQEPELEAQPEAEQNVPPMEGEGWSFVKMPIIRSCGFPCSYIGVRSECTPDVICYALPARYTPEPPPGLDDYEWLGENGTGWWVYCQSPTSEE
jgi:hypothetical protein